MFSFSFVYNPVACSSNSFFCLQFLVAMSSLKGKTILVTGAGQGEIRFSEKCGDFIFVIVFDDLEA